MKKRLLSFVLCAVMVLTCVPFALSVSAAEGTPKNDNVVYVADSGKDNGTGTTPTDPVNDFSIAMDKLAKTGGVIVVVGYTTIFTGINIMPEHDKPITITSYYDGVDYRNKIFPGDAIGARLVFQVDANNAFTLGGDLIFDYITFAWGSVSANTIISCNFHDFTVTENCDATFEDIDGTVWFTDSLDGHANARTYVGIILSGENKAEGGQNVKLDQNINVFGGMWNGVRVGDRDNVNRNTYDGVVNVNVGGDIIFTQFTGDYKANNLSVMPVYQSSTTKDFVCNYTITGGTINTQIVGFGVGGGVTVGDYVCAGTVNLKISGCKFNRVYAGANGNGNFIRVASQQPGANSKGVPIVFEDTATVNIWLDTNSISFNEFEGVTVTGVDYVKCNLTVTADKFVTCEGIDMKVEAGSTPAVTDAPTVTDAPVVTEAPTVTDAPVVTTEAPAQAEPTPSTGDASIMVVFAAAAVVCLAAVVVLKKREN